MMLRRLYESPFVRFAVVGGVATAVNYAVYVVLVRCFDDLWPALAYFCAFCVSIVCNFLLSSYFTFRVRPSARRAVRFLTAHLINLVNELVLLKSGCGRAFRNSMRRCAFFWSPFRSIS